MTVNELIEALQSLPEEYKSLDVMVYAHASLMESLRLVRYGGQGSAEEVDRLIVIHAD